MIRIGLVGLGGVAGIHICAYDRIKEAKIVAVADALGEAALDAALIVLHQIAVDVRLCFKVDVEHAHGGVGLAADVGNRHFKEAGLGKQFLSGLRQSLHFCHAQTRLGGVNAFYVFNKVLTHWHLLILIGGSFLLSCFRC